MKRLIRMTTMTALTVAAATLLTSGSLLRGAEGDEGTKTEQHGQFSKKDYKFALDAAQGGLLEVKLGDLAKQKGTNPTIQQFGEQMVKDHSKANEELKGIVTQKGATLPDQLSRKEEKELERLQKLSGRDFDKSYAEHMVKEHKKDIKEFQGAAKDAQDPDLKAFAQKTLPTLEHHHQMAEQMESALKQQEP